MFEELIEVVVFLNLFLSILIVVEDIYFYLKVKEDSSWSKLFYASVGFAWFVRYILFYLQLHPFSIDDVNPLILLLTTFTLLAMAVGANIRVKRDIGPIVIINDLKSIPKVIKAAPINLKTKIKAGIRWIFQR